MPPGMRPLPETPRNRLRRAAGVAPGRGWAPVHEVPANLGARLVLRVDIDVLGLAETGDVGRDTSIQLLVLESQPRQNRTELRWQTKAVGTSHEQGAAGRT